MNREYLEEKEFNTLLPGKKYKMYFQENDCVLAETEEGDVVVAFSQYEYYGMTDEEIEKKIYEGIKSRKR
ncbi:MAG: hypothetical protein IJS76_00035 [Pseudobutyrivibrio sp.]|nr:hypothetical protein [Pseudobutyrivibrio sp.]